MSLLDHRAFRHGVGKGHAKFNNIGTTIYQSAHKWHCEVLPWITRHNIGDQGGAALFRQLLETSLNTTHYSLQKARLELDAVYLGYRMYVFITSAR